MPLPPPNPPKEEEQQQNKTTKEGEKVSHNLTTATAAYQLLDAVAKHLNQQVHFIIIFFFKGIKKQ